MSENSSEWQFWVDRGGTFTDIVALTPQGELVTHKLLSENPRNYRDAAIEGMRHILFEYTSNEISDDPSLTIKMGTTVATNALLERKGEPTLLVISKGFADALRIGYQNRPDLFSLNIHLPEMLYSEVLEIDERVGADSQLLKPLDENEARKGLQKAYAQGIRSVAIVFMFGFRYPDHEIKVAKLAQKIGFQQISTSHQASPLMKLVSRGDTTVVDAYLSPILRRYVSQLESELINLTKTDCKLQFMQSSGGLTEAHHFAGKDAILSGPAGGVVGMVETARIAGFEQLIGFDMGGTSTDVCHFAGELERSFETEVAGVRMRAPMMQIHTVAAGGGSILHFDGERYRVGPDSAGADPGPACYCNDGPLTVTDCNVMLGKLQPQFFPQVFGDKGEQALDIEIVARKFSDFARNIKTATGEEKSLQHIAAGFLTIAVENMANAVKKISVQRGYDIAQYTLCCFGGAGGQHACLVADALRMKRIFLHPFSGVLSAYGMGLANTTKILERSIEKELKIDLISKLKDVAIKLCVDGKADLLSQGMDEKHIQCQSKIYCYYEGSDTALVVDLLDFESVKDQFELQHGRSFGFVTPDKSILVRSIEVETIASNPVPQISQPVNDNHQLQAFSHHAVAFSALSESCQKHSTPFYLREQLPCDQWLKGPAVIIGSTSTIVVEPGWQAQLTPQNNIVLERFQPLPQQYAVGTDVDPVMLEIFNNLFMSIAEQMGVVLENTALSVNIKERLDFSCALFDVDGDLISNAPHMPVHLGSMSESIKSVVSDHNGNMQKGDAFVLNAPYNGGTHLPDVTIIKPVFDIEGDSVIFYVASRGHHADIGGVTPGSMPSNSVSVDEEGILLDNFKIVKAGIFQEQKIRKLLASGNWPARNIDMNIADFKAQLASCEKGMQELNRIVSHYSLAVVHAYMKHVQDNAEESVRRVLDVLNDGDFTSTMDDGSQIKVSIVLNKKKRSATIDFTGTSAQHRANFNAPSAISRACVLYVFRCLVDDQIPLNEGCLKPLKIILPSNSMINPVYPAAVVAGNVETSQAIVDTLLGALGVVAASQGTMNNITWGNERYQYYETLCGGEGARDGHHGCSAVHTHMTNSRLTDPEVLEWRFPVTLESFSIRKGSGGDGKFLGGDGVIRKIRFNEAMSLSLLTGHRKVAPYGLKGGSCGKLGMNQLLKNSGETIKLGSTDSVEVEAGDTLLIKTPGGGGYGKAMS